VSILAGNPLQTAHLHTHRLRLNRTLFLALLAKMRLRDIPVVLTAHNLRPHEEHGRMGRLLTERLLRRTRVWIRLNAFTPTRRVRSRSCTATTAPGWRATPSGRHRRVG
jgi:hypothetical protein